MAEALPELRQAETRLLHVFIEHAPASLTLNDNADPDNLDPLSCPQGPFCLCASARCL